MCAFAFWGRVALRGGWHARAIMYRTMLQGPCRVEGCVDPTRKGGQWGFIPEAYCLTHDLTFKVDCTCKKPRCLRACGKLQTAPQLPGAGRKRKESPSPATTSSLVEEPLPRPPTIVTIDEVWADRYATLPPTHAHRSCLISCVLSAWQVRRHRGVGRGRPW